MGVLLIQGENRTERSPRKTEEGEKKRTMQLMMNWRGEEKKAEEDAVE